MMADNEEKKEPEVPAPAEVVPEVPPTVQEVTPPRRARSRTRTAAAAEETETVTEEEAGREESGETIREIRQVARDTWSRTARSTRKTASILGFKLRKAVRRKNLHDVYQEIGEFYYTAVKAGQAPKASDPQLAKLVSDAERLQEEISELEQKEEAVRGL